MAGAEAPPRSEAPPPSEAAPPREAAPARERPARLQVEEARQPRRRAFGMRTREAGAAAVGAVGSGVIMLARLVMAAASLIALLIALAIVLRDVNANAHNTIVKGIHEGANFFAGAFTGLISFNAHPKRAITVDWGIALVVYLLVGAIISGYIRRIGRGGVGYERRHRGAAV